MSAMQSCTCQLTALLLIPFAVVLNMSFAIGREVPNPPKALWRRATVCDNFILHSRAQH